MSGSNILDTSGYYRSVFPDPADVTLATTKNTLKRGCFCITIGSNDFDRIGIKPIRLKRQLLPEVSLRFQLRLC